MTSRLQVDFNNLARNGQVRLTHIDLARTLTVGDAVIAEDSIEGLEYPATVDDIDSETGRIYLDVHWGPGNPELWV